MSNSNKQDNLVNTARSDKQALNKNPSIFKNALKMAFGTMTSRVLGLLRESFMAALFDKHITDAFNAAFRIPNLFRRLLGEGSLSVSFIPVFVEAEQEDRLRAQNMINSLYTILLILVGTITVFGVLFPELFLNALLSPSYVENTNKMLITTQMTRIMFLFLFFITSFAFFMGILNSLGRFFWPALAPTFWNIAMIISTVWPVEWLPESMKLNGDQLAWGVVVGGALQVFILVPGLIQVGYLPRVSLKVLNKDSFLVLKNMIPGFIGTGLLQFMTIVNLGFASAFTEGTISYMNYVDRLIELPLSLISVSLGSALLPALSLLWTQNKIEEFSETSRKYLELNLLVSVAAACGLYVFSEPVIQLLFGRGKFSLEDVRSSALILKSYCWIMLFVSGIRVLTPAYYAVKNTWFPMVISAVALALHISIAPILMKSFQIHGLMISTTISAAANMFLLILFYSRFVSSFSYIKFILSLVKISIIGFVVFGASELLSPWIRIETDSFFMLTTKLAVCIGGVCLLFFGTSVLLGFSDLRSLSKRVVNKLGFGK